MQHSVYGTQSGQRATDVDLCPRGLSIGLDDLSLSARGPASHIFDPQRRHEGVTRTLNWRNDGERTVAGGNPGGAAPQARQVGQRQVRPCLAMSRPTACDRPGVARSQATAPTSTPTPFIHRSAAMSQAALRGQAGRPMSPSMVSRRPRAVSEQVTVQKSPSTVFGGVVATRGHAMASMSPSTVSARPAAAPDHTTAPISPFTVTRRSSAVPCGAGGELPFGTFAPGVRPRMLAMSAPVSATPSAVQAGNHHHPTSSLSSSSPIGPDGNDEAGGLRELGTETSPDNLDPAGGTAQYPGAFDTGPCARAATAGRPKGSSQGKSCHGCRTTAGRVRGQIKVECGAPECKYWLCLNCLRKWQMVSGMEEYHCCMHKKDVWCPCTSR